MVCNGWNGLDGWNSWNGIDGMAGMKFMEQLGWNRWNGMKWKMPLLRSEVRIVKFFLTLNPK